MSHELLNASLLDLALKGAAVLAAGHLLVLLLRRASAAARHLVLMLSTLAVLLLPLLAVSLPQWNALPARPRTRNVQPISPAVTAAPVDQPALDVPPAAPSSGVPASAGMTQPVPRFDWTAWIGTVWLAGAVICLLPLLMGSLSLALLKRRCKVINDGSWRSLLDQCASQLQLRRSVVLLRSDQRTMPMTWGAFSGAKLLMPAEADQWSAAQRRAVMLHELGHVKRRDCLMHVLAQLACAMHWFNPLAWWALHRMRTLRESACDDLVLTAEGHFRGSDYAQQLLDLAAGLRAPALSAYASIAMARPSALEGRLLAILDPRKCRKAVTRRVMLAAAALCLLIAAPLAMLRAAAPQEANTTPVSSGLSATIDGATVELVGISNPWAKDWTWWKPDGTATGDDLLDEYGGISWTEDSWVYAVAVRVTPDHEQHPSVVLAFPDAHHSGSFKAIRRGKEIEDLTCWSFAIAKDKTLDATTVIVDVAVCPWQAVNTAVGSGSMAMGGNNREHNIALAPAYEQDGSVHVTAAVSSSASWEVRIVAIDRNDKEYLPTGSTGASTPDARSITCQFKGLTLDQLKGFRQEVRPYQTVVFQNVSLKRGHATQPAAVLSQAGAAATPGGDTPSLAARGVSSNDALLNADQRLVLEWTNRQFSSYFDRRTFAGWTDQEKAQLETRAIDALKGPRSREYYSAIGTLAALHSQKGLESLRAIAFDRAEKDNRDRWMAIRALGLMGDTQSVPQMIPLLYHGNLNTHWWAQISLVRLTGQNFGDDWKAWGTWWNGQHGDPSFDGQWVRWSKDPQWSEPDLLIPNIAKSDRKFLQDLRGSAPADAPPSNADPANTDAAAQLSAEQHRDRIIVEDLARELMVAIRDKDDAAFAKLATDQVIPGWIDALPHLALEIRESYREKNDGKPINVIEISDVVVADKGAAAKFPGPPGAKGTYAALFFVKTSDGWRNYLLRNAPPNVTLEEMLAKYPPQGPR
ncbi:MAG: M56 family metallopeptidase [Phycisphaeraceae bacterium]|nr:M56 family metallopeptidase [Phycisphaeraceae bacterium]